MKEVRNSINKLVCRIDENERVVEIVVKGCITLIRFCKDGKAEIKNIKAA